MDDKKFYAFVICIMVFSGFSILVLNYYRGPKQIDVYLTLNDEPFQGWVEIMSPSGEYIEDQAQRTSNGHYCSLKEYSQGRSLYVIAWIDLGYQVGDFLYVLGMRVRVLPQIGEQSFELSDGNLWLFPDNTTWFGEDW